MEETNFTPQPPLSPQPGVQPGAAGAAESSAPVFDRPEGAAGSPPPPVNGAPHVPGGETPPVPPGIPPLSPAKQAKKALRRCSNRNSLLLLLLVVGTNLVALGVLLVMKLLGVRMSTSAFATVANLISYGSLYLVMAPLLLLIGNAGQPHKVRTYFTKPKASGKEVAKWTLIGVGLTYGISYVFNFLFTIIQLLFGVELAAPSLVTDTGFANALISFFFMALAAPLMEELIFRGTLLCHTLPFGSWFAIVVVGISFGLTHMNYQQLFYAIMMGIAAGFVAVKSQSIWPALGIHLSINLIGAAQSILVGHIDLSVLTGGGSSRYVMTYLLSKLPYLLPVLLLSLLCLAAAVGGFVLFVIEVVNHKDTFRLENPCTVLTPAQKAGAYLSAPGTILTLVVMLGMTVCNALGVL
ncbi:CPBP family intramembrane glutamic endopeptidase [Bittarella massiliensis (ex Durand et al. 2017)]|uniref:CPBP family intramembrane glutamic endopeptidase n=1 Tax=Bittarella massiliensis (ex Durand et al. 2017) TaxID=1720313 RepID=UPI001AA1C98C|nr:type II CAAX endopeptidase family protein [Bittarella massiliensis (ex Durand et al. 2017)]MBO1679579.1 CPBP family intramembrane metalloprotease [Bittarella massiliensis (ex Durand et al. 2017)]